MKLYTMALASALAWCGSPSGTSGSPRCEAGESPYVGQDATGTHVRR